MAPKVYFIPGIGESLLSHDTVDGELIWVGVPALILGKFGLMRLASNGISPGAPDGGELLSSGLLGPYAGLPTYQLALQFLGTSTLVFGYDWDWRKSILTAGDSLATHIRSQVTPGEPCALICHSAGGLVARRAWSNLVGTGEQGLVWRIATIGTPHWGSYQTVNAFGANTQIIDSLYDFNQTIGGLLGGPLQAPGYVSWTKEGIRDLLLTWPSLYELLPSLLDPLATQDPNRALLFQKGNWDTSVNVQQVWLDHARTVFQPWANSAASKPTDDVLICVGSYGTSTANTLVSTSAIGVGTNLGNTDEGDGVVTKHSAQLAGSTTYGVSSLHQDQYPQAVNNGNAYEWVTVVIVRTPTPAPEVVDTRPDTVQLPPIPPAPSWGAFGSGGARRVASCVA